MTRYEAGPLAVGIQLTLIFASRSSVNAGGLSLGAVKS